MAAIQTMQNLPQAADYVRILPEIVLSIFGMAIMLLDPVIDATVKLGPAGIQSHFEQAEAPQRRPAAAEQRGHPFTRQ